MRLPSPTPRRLLLGAACLFASSSAVAVDHAVTVGGSGLVFSPLTLNVAAGDTVTFTNAGGFHNVRSDSVDVFRCAAGCDGAGGDGSPSSATWSATVPFATPGTVPVYCEIHGAPGQGMHMTINVTVPVDLQSFEID